MTDREIEAMHNQPVLVLTQGGTPVSLGRVRVSRPLNAAAAPRVEIVFETETLACAIGVPADRVPRLHASFDGQQYQHRLPEGDKVWLPAGWSAQSGEQKPPAITTSVETFPLPPKAKLGSPPGADMTKPGK